MKFQKCWQCGKQYMVFKQCLCSDNIMDYVIVIGTLNLNVQEKEDKKC